MLKNLSSKDVAWILGQIGITLKRRSKEDSKILPCVRKYGIK